jgi:hypothetical protein
MHDYLLDAVCDRRCARQAGALSNTAAIARGVRSTAVPVLVLVI